MPPIIRNKFALSTVDKNTDAVYNHDVNENTLQVLIPYVIVAALVIAVLLGVIGYLVEERNRRLK